MTNKIIGLDLWKINTIIDVDRLIAHETVMASYDPQCQGKNNVAHPLDVIMIVIIIWGPKMLGILIKWETDLFR